MTDDWTIPVLDHGYVRLRNLAGPTRRLHRCFDADDVDFANSARFSFDEADKGRAREDDLKLASYLVKHKHTTPIEMVVAWMEMKMPIFVARQMVRHRTVSINEVSARYTKLPNEFYIPLVGNVGKKSKSNKQGRDVEEMSLSEETVARKFVETLGSHCALTYASYETFLALGVAPELARCILPLNIYTKWLWKQDLHNLMHFLSLRDHSHAQFESREYAKAIDQLIRQVLPHSMKLYDLYRRQET